MIHCGKVFRYVQGKNACAYSMNLKVYSPIFNETKNGTEIEELTKGGTHEIKEAKHLEGKLRFELQQAKYQITELETAVAKVFHMFLIFFSNFSLSFIGKAAIITSDGKIK